MPAAPRNARKSIAQKEVETRLAEQKDRAKALTSGAWTEESSLKNTLEMFEDMEAVIFGVATRARPRGLIISGGPGIGKTHRTIDILNNRAECPFEVIAGTISPPHLFLLGWRMRDEGSVAVLDDSDSILWDAEGAGLIKKFTDTHDVRNVSYMKAWKGIEEEGAEREFVFEGSFMFLTNINIQPIIDEGRHKAAQHLRAIVNRTSVFDTGLHDRRDIAVYVKYLVTETKMWEKHGLDEKMGHTVLDWVLANADNARELSVRNFIIAADFAASVPNAWVRIASRSLLRPGTF